MYYMENPAITQNGIHKRFQSLEERETKKYIL